MHNRPIVPVPIALHRNELHYGDARAVAYTRAPHTNLSEYWTARSRPVTVPKRLGGDDQSVPVWAMRCGPRQPCIECRTTPCIKVPSPGDPPPTYLAMHRGLAVHAREVLLPGHASFLVIPPGATVDDVNAAATAWTGGASCERQLHVFHLAEDLGDVRAGSFVVIPVVTGAHIDLTEMFSDARH